MHSYELDDIKELNRRFLNGGSLTDTDLRWLLLYYRNIVKISEFLDETFDSFRSELQSRLDKLETFDSEKEIA